MQTGRMRRSARVWITPRYWTSVVEWAERDANVRALVLEGSLARDEASVDERGGTSTSACTSPTRTRCFGESRGGFEQFGDVLVVEALANPGWHPTRLVYYVDGKIDFMIAPATSFGGASGSGDRYVSSSTRTD